MIEAPLAPSCELVVGLVGPIGTDLSAISAKFGAAFLTVGIPRDAVHEVRVVELLHQLKPWKDLEHEPEWKRYKSHIDGASEFCSRLTPAALASMAVARLRSLRSSATAAARYPRQVFIIRSLKRPEEVKLLREVYGRSFLLIACSANKENRSRSLELRFERSDPGRREGQYAARAAELIETDEFEGSKTGQNVRDTFGVADFFLDANEPSSCGTAVKRFVELLFGQPFVTPTSDEYAMFQASSAALRSSDLSRQVGAALVRDRGAVLALGCNDSPRFGGGQYWCEDRPDGRDFAIGQDAGFEERKSVLGDLLERLRRAGWLESSLSEPASQLVQRALGLEALRESRVMDVLEFGRSVHAEMAAICDAARRGVAVDGAWLFSTTYPCHECARHIIAAGIVRVVYISPYPKSAASRLFGDSWASTGSTGGGRVRVEPFIGVGPRLYAELFSMRPRRDSAGGVASWDGALSSPRRQEPESVVRSAENAHIHELHSQLERAGIGWITQAEVK